MTGRLPATGSCQALVGRGATLHDLRQYGEALKSYRRALAVRPDHVEALVNRGVTLHKLAKQPAEALNSYDRALAMEPDDVEALTNRGVALHDLERYGEALASHQRGLPCNRTICRAQQSRRHAAQAWAIRRGVSKL